MPSIPVVVTGTVTPASGRLNAGNLVSAIKNHKLNNPLSPQDKLGVQTLGRNTGLALDQITTALQVQGQPTAVTLTGSINAADIIPLIFTKLEVTLAATTTTISTSSPTIEGQELLVYIIQDATGGRQITWASNFRYIPVNIDTAPNTTSVFTFSGRIDPSDNILKWFMTTLPLTGQS